MRTRFAKVLPGMGLALLILVLLPVAARGQWKVSGPDENSFIKLGFLCQGQAEWLDTPDTFDTSQNLFIRRFRILMGGNITDRLSFFFETDSPNLGKYDSATGRKVEGDVYIQDFFATYSFGDEFKIDGGLMLLPLSHNSEQSAATLLPVDYGPYSFLASTPTQSRVGRDYGVQARGYLLEKHLEYRMGVYQGIRDVGVPDTHADAPFRYVGRIVIHFLEPETSFFYTGATLGKKKILSLGASADLQDEYKAYAGDLFWDQPLKNGDAVTFQADYIYYDGDETFPTLLAQNVWLFELGYYQGSTRLGAFGQVAFQNFVQDPYQDENRYQGGIAYWGAGHNFNLKLAYTIIYKEHAFQKSHVYRDQYVLQCQVFQF